MRIDGRWLLCDDGFVRPVVRGEILASNGSWLSAEFLVDTGADCTVISALILEALRLPPAAAQGCLGGVGGVAESITVETQIRFSRETGSKVLFRSQYAAFSQVELLDMCILGRDVTDLLAVVVDRPRDVVCLLGQRHRYTIEQS
ncbi:MAG: aspartyl protease family protein [Deltaproteobacteria bacterium]|nr:aspartyl protease family protein [Deltaproteobacteria bacterium]